MYTINGTDISTYGFLPAQAPDSNIAIKGCFDMPGRIGKSFQEWADEPGVEPYLRADEIFFGGRDIDLHTAVIEAGKSAALNKLYAFFDSIDTYTTLVPLVTDYGTFQVLVKSVEASNLLSTPGYCNVKITFREPVVNMDLGTAPAAGPDNSEGIDDIPFATLGLVKTRFEGDLNRPDLKNQFFTAYGKEGYQVTKRGARDQELRAYIESPTMTGFQAIINNLIAVLKRPGKRTLIMEDGSYREFFVKDGFEVSGVRIHGSRVFGMIAIKLTELEVYFNWNQITNNTGNVLANKHGHPLIFTINKF